MDLFHSQHMKTWINNHPLQENKRKFEKYFFLAYDTINV